MGMEQLNALGGMVNDLEADNPSQESQQASAEQAQATAQADIGAKQWGMIMFTLGGFAQMVAPELKPVYSEDRCFSWGQQAQAVSEKYGWSGPSNMPELALIASTAGFLVPTYFVLRGKVEQAKAAKDGTLLEKLAAWWQHRKAMRAQRQAQRGQGRAGEVVAEAAEVPSDGRQQ